MSIKEYFRMNKITWSVNVVRSGMHAPKRIIFLFFFLDLTIKSSSSNFRSQLKIYFTLQYTKSTTQIDSKHNLHYRKKWNRKFLPLFRVKKNLLKTFYTSIGYLYHIIWRYKCIHFTNINLTLFWFMIGHIIQHKNLTLPYLSASKKFFVFFFFLFLRHPYTPKKFFMRKYDVNSCFILFL